MQPYRLEMGTRLANERGKNLYDFWGSLITGALNKALKEVDGAANAVCQTPEQVVEILQYVMEG